jgi:hypothetical protein
VRDVEQVASEFAADRQPYAVFIDNNLGSKPDYLRRLCRALEPLRKIWSAAVTIDVTDDPTLVRGMALAAASACFIGFRIARRRQPRRIEEKVASPRRLRAARQGSSTAMASR